MKQTTVIDMQLSNSYSVENVYVSCPYINEIIFKIVCLNNPLIAKLSRSNVVHESGYLNGGRFVQPIKTL
jgi:hypothetical protein